jgi:hypothetical protein
MQLAMKASFSGCVRAGLTCSAWAKQEVSTSAVAAKAGVTIIRARQATAIVTDFRFILRFLPNVLLVAGDYSAARFGRRPSS